MSCDEPRRWKRSKNKYTTTSASGGPKYRLYSSATPRTGTYSHEITATTDASPTLVTVITV